MAADQERADRIRQLKQDNPALKWRHIADHVGVELRSAQMWQETGAISYDSAKKLAELFDDVDVDWIMRGREATTPSPFAGSDATHSLHETLSEIQQQNTVILDAIRQSAEQGKRQRDEIIAGIETLLQALEGRVEESVSGVEHLQSAFDRVLEALDAPGSPADAGSGSPAPPETARRARSRQRASSTPR